MATRIPNTEKIGQPNGPLSRPTAERLSLYLRCLENWVREGVATVSSSRIATTLCIGDAQVRKDLGHLGSLGQPGIGYRVSELVAVIRQTLGIHRKWTAVLIGVGNLARALLKYQGFSNQGFEIAAVFDKDETKVGQKIEGLTIQHIDTLKDQVTTLGAELAIVTVPAEAAQDAADRLAEAGIRGILNFAPAMLRLPDGLRVVNVDLAMQLEQLAFQVQLGAPVE